MIEKTCLTCRQTLRVAPWQIRVGKGKYCSVACSGIGRRRPIVRTCERSGCEQTFITKSAQIARGRGRFCSHSCGAKMQERGARTHGHASRGGRSPTYTSWAMMRARCNRSTATAFEYYGGRGITVCERWQKSFENFLADMGERPGGMTLDRIDPDGNYEPGNCRWATPAEQTRNRRILTSIAA